eukprot:m.1330613 g.1330613  ORF g.1330613 m.1330613 type:complete len:445 (-) comp24862_c0_seq7:3032-4366(-)
MVTLFKMATVAIALSIPHICLGEGEVALPSTGEVIALSDETFNELSKNTELMVVNFYANWCRFSQMLKPIYAQTASQLKDEPRVRLGSIDCEAPDTAATRTANHISKYPTIKIYRRGVPLKSEYRGQRSPSAIIAYLQELLAEPVISLDNDEDVDAHLSKFRRMVIGHFNDENHANIAPFHSLAEKLRDTCHFVLRKSSPHVGEDGSKIVFKSRAEEVEFDGDLSSPEMFLEWAVEHCSPLVREITFENGEELTEEGLPFLILFHDPDNHDPVVQFTQEVKKRLSGERGSINFITADGTKFSHPLKHLGKSKKDLPVLAFDTFKHMYLFKKFSNIFKGDKLEQFVADLHSGKLHHNFHNPQPEQPDDEDDDRDTLQEKVDAAKIEKAPEVHESLKDTPTDKAPGAAEHHDEEDDPMKPVPVKSILKNLKPSENRYSLLHNRDEL